MLYNIRERKIPTAGRLAAAACSHVGCVKEDVVYTHLPEWLCALRAFGKCSHVWKLMAGKLMGVLIAFQLGHQQPHKLDVFQQIYLSARGAHCQAAGVRTTHHTSLIQLKSIADAGTPWGWTGDRLWVLALYLHTNTGNVSANITHITYPEVFEVNAFLF